MDELATTAEHETQAERSRRSWWWTAGVLVVLGVASVVALVISRNADTVATEPQGPTNTAEVVRTDLVDETVYDGTLGTTEDDTLVAPSAGVVSFSRAAGDTVSPGEVAFAIDGEPILLLSGANAAHRDFRLGADTTTIAARTMGTLTEIVEPGAILEQGAVIARIDDEPIVLLYGEVPMYRTLEDLSENLTGVDVRQLEQALTDLGHNNGDVTVDEEFTQATEEMVERWQAELGVEEDGIVTVADVVFSPGPAQAVNLAASVGDRMADGTVLATLSTGEPLAGADVRQLEQALVDLGYDAGDQLTVDDVFDASTAKAIGELEAAVGAKADGMLAAGDVRFAEGPVKVTEVAADVGTTVAAGAPVLMLASPDKIVTFDLPAADQGLVSVGDGVTVELPDGVDVPGTVSLVAETATTAADQQAAVFEVEVTLDDPTVAGDLEQAPVDVAVVSESVRDVIAVPVAALLALAEGGYAVEVVDDDGTTRLVGVEPGFFAAGLVEIESGSLDPGTRVVVP